MRRNDQSRVSDEIIKTEKNLLSWPVQREPVNRVDRRNQRTRAALIQAAQALIAAGKLNVPVLEITQAADVGMGSFYNHFDSKEELFEAAVADVLDNHGALLDQLTAEIEDPAEDIRLQLAVDRPALSAPPTGVDST
jgi:AcrR family transcriptional regulator